MFYFSLINTGPSHTMQKTGSQHLGSPLSSSANIALTHPKMAWRVGSKINTVKAIKDGWKSLSSNMQPHGDESKDSNHRVPGFRNTQHATSNDADATAASPTTPVHKMSTPTTPLIDSSLSTTRAPTKKLLSTLGVSAKSSSAPTNRGPSSPQGITVSLYVRALSFAHGVAKPDVTGSQPPVLTTGGWLRLNHAFRSNPSTPSGI